MTVYCNNYGERTGCLGEADDQYTMNFDEIDRPLVSWCSYCGPDAHKMNEMLEDALSDGDPKFREKLIEMIEQCENRQCH